MVYKGVENGNHNDTIFAEFSISFDRVDYGTLLRNSTHRESKKKTQLDKILPGKKVSICSSEWKDFRNQKTLRVVYPRAVFWDPYFSWCSLLTFQIHAKMLFFFCLPTISNLKA